MRTNKLFIAGALVLSLALPAAAQAADKHLLPGTPGTKSCEGQTTAYIAQLGKNPLAEGSPLEGIHGFSKIGEAAGYDNKGLHQLIADYCAQTP